MRISDWSSDVCSSDLLQALGLSIAQAGGASALPSYVRLIEIFENNGQLDRRVEGLASNEELLRRIQEGQGLTRPELAILLSPAKLPLQVASERLRHLAADPTVIDGLAASFPPSYEEGCLWEECGSTCRPLGPSEHGLRGPH